MRAYSEIGAYFRCTPKKRTKVSGENAGGEGEGRERTGKKKERFRVRAHTRALTLRLTENYNYEPRGAFARHKNLKQCRASCHSAPVSRLGSSGSTRFGLAQPGLARQERLLIENYRKAQLRENYFYSLAGWRCSPASVGPTNRRKTFPRPAAFFFSTTPSPRRVPPPFPRSLSDRSRVA